MSLKILSSYLVGISNIICFSNVTRAKNLNLPQMYTFSFIKFLVLLMPPICLRVQMSVSHRGALVTASCFSKQVLAVYFCAKTSLKSSKNAIIATGSEC